MGFIKYLKKSDNKLLFTGNVMEAYVKKSYFDKKINEFIGDKVSLYGLFNFRVSETKTSVINNKSKLHVFNFPVHFVSIPSSIQKKELELVEGCGLEKYYVLTYNTNDIVMNTTQCVKDIDNVKCFIDLLISGNLPNTINYEDVLKITFNVMEVNGESCGCPGIVESIIVAELYRYKKDQSIPFRKAINRFKNVSQLDYVANNTRSVSANNSTFSGLTFEDIDTMLVYAVNKKRYNKTENESPIEQIIKV